MILLTVKLYNSLYKYGLLSKLFHWVTFILLIIQIPLGLYLVKLDFSEERISLEELHIILGIIIFYFTLLRLIWKFKDPKKSPKRGKFKGQIIFDLKSPDGTYRKGLNSKKIRDLGWLPKIKLKDGLKQVIENKL